MECDWEQKIRARFLEAPTKSQTLEELVKNELAEKKNKATQALLWLTRFVCIHYVLSGLTRMDAANRGLQFTSLALRRSQDNPSEELSVSFTKAYEGSLKQYHSFVVKPLFGVSTLHPLVCNS